MSKRRVARFVSVGVFNTLFDFVVLNVLVFAIGFHRLPANIISTLCAVTLSYFLNHSFVFKDEAARTKRQYFLFISITLFGLLVLQNIVIYLFMHPFVGIANTLYDHVVTPLFGQTFSKEFIQLNFAKALATVVTMVWNYQLYQRLVFTKRAKSIDENSKHS